MKHKKINEKQIFYRRALTKSKIEVKMIFLKIAKIYKKLNIRKTIIMYI